MLHYFSRISFLFLLLILILLLEKDGRALFDAVVGRSAEEQHCI